MTSILEFLMARTEVSNAALVMVLVVQFVSNVWCVRAQAPAGKP